MRAEPHVLTGAYAAHALPDVERAAFERHLEGCLACAREVPELEAALARLGSATATAPPAGLWDRVRAEAAAAALLVMVVSLAALNLGLSGRGGRPQRAAELVAAVLAAPDARRVAARPGGAGQAAVVVSPGQGRAVFEASGLAPAPAGRTYQLWVVDQGGPRPAGLVEAGGGGGVTRLLDGQVTGTERVAVTVERRGGAARPTSEPVVVVDLRA